MVETLLAGGADAGALANWECVQCAVGYGDKDIVTQLVNAGATVNHYDADTLLTPLTRAIKAGFTIIVHTRSGSLVSLQLQYSYERFLILLIIVFI